MVLPYRRAFNRAYRHRWMRRCWERTLIWEKRIGLAVSAILAAVLAVAEGVTGATVRVGPLLLAVAGSFAAVFALLWIIAGLVTPAELAWEAEEDSGDLVSRLSIAPVEDAPYFIVEWPTRGNNRTGWVDTQEAIHTLRLIEPVSKVVRAMDLPQEIRLPWGGSLTIKAFGPRGMLIEERRTKGRMIRAEVYFK